MWRCFRLHAARPSSHGLPTCSSCSLAPFDQLNACLKTRIDSMHAVSCYSSLTTAHANVGIAAALSPLVLYDCMATAAAASLYS